jgi:DNA-binding IclR family transcriptional regulator
MAHGSSGRSSLSRHLAVLDAFDADAPFLTLSQIARRSGIPLSSVHRLVAELEQQRLIERLDDRTLRLGVRLWEFAARTPGAVGLRELALPYMQNVHAQVRQHTQLAVMSGDEVLFLERLSTRDAVVNATVVGGRLPLHASSSGIVLLAHAPLDTQERYLASEMEQFTARTPHRASAVRSELAAARRDGFVVANGYIHPDARGIAVPLVGADGSVIAALAVVVANDDESAIPLVASLRAASGEISAALRAASLPSSDPAAEPGGQYRPLVHSSTKSMEYLASADHRKRR